MDNTNKKSGGPKQERALPERLFLEYLHGPALPLPILTVEEHMGMHSTQPHRVPKKKKIKAKAKR